MTNQMEAFNQKTSACVLLLASLLTACTAPVGVKGVKVPPDSAAICAEHCASIGMQLSAVAIMANNVGCVCQHVHGPAGVSQSSPITAGMATIVMQEAAEQEASERRRRQQTSQ
jgi:hypothetical protein